MNPDPLRTIAAQAEATHPSATPAIPAANAAVSQLGALVDSLRPQFEAMRKSMDAMHEVVAPVVAAAHRALADAAENIRRAVEIRRWIAAAQAKTRRLACRRSWRVARRIPRPRRLSWALSVCGGGGGPPPRHALALHVGGSSP